MVGVGAVVEAVAAVTAFVAVVCEGEEEDGQGAQEEGQLQGPEPEEGCSTVEVAANVPDAHCTLNKRAREMLAGKQ